MKQALTEIQCSMCKQVKPVSEYNLTNKKKKVGTYEPHTRSYWQSGCKECMSIYGKQWDSLNNDKKQASYNRNKIRPERRLKILLGIKHVDRSNLDFDILYKRLQDNDFKCEVTKIPFNFVDSKNPCTLSIDRIDPTKGYTNDNVRLVCWWLNTAMGDWGLDKLKELIQMWGINNE